jgi:hypothetical protein
LRHIQLSHQCKTKARSAFGRLNKIIWRSNILTTKTKLKLLNAMVKPVLFYGSESWLVTSTVKNYTQKLQPFVNRCLRSILKIWWPGIISNQELWTPTARIRTNRNTNQQNEVYRWTYFKEKRGGNP